MRGIGEAAALTGDNSCRDATSDADASADVSNFLRVQATMPSKLSSFGKQMPILDSDTVPNFAMTQNGRKRGESLRVEPPAANLTWYALSGRILREQLGELLGHDATELLGVDDGDRTPVVTRDVMADADGNQFHR